MADNARLQDAAEAIANQSFRQILERHLGKEFTVVNPETFDDSAFGHQLHAAWYHAKLVALGLDFAVLVMEYQHGSGKSATKEPCEQYVPLAKIRRVSVMKSERILHI